MEQERIWTLLSRKLVNEARDAEKAELDVLLQEYPELNKVVQQISDNWEQSFSDESEFIEATFLLHLERMKARGIPFTASETDYNNITTANDFAGNIPQRKNAFAYLALSLCLLLITSAFAYYVFNVRSSLSQGTIADNKENKKEIVTENGTRTKTQLPDGTVVWLNAGSKVMYEGDFTGPIRDIYLTGEAYFDVAKDHSRPFIVHTGDINIKALGTAFNVRSYPSDEIVEATLLRGLVEITRQDDINAKAIFLHPNQKLTFIKNSGIGINNLGTGMHVSSYSVTKVEVQSEKELPETAWMFNRLSFKNDDFEALARKMERWYNVRIVFRDDAMKKIHFNGSLENETVDQALTALQMAVPFTYKINDHDIYISSLSD